MNLYPLFKSIAFQFDAEQVHHLTMKALSTTPYIANLLPRVSENSKYELYKNGLCWSFPVGLAAGFDKNAQCIEFFEKLGFGAIEVGTITKLAQVGNARPRIFRYPNEESIRNAMGFPNLGSDEILKEIHKSNSRKINLGANLGKNKNTTIAETPREYAELYQKFAPVSDYLVINISSPNTKGLRSFQQKDQLAPLLSAVSEKHKQIPKPLFLKISPDLEPNEITLICELIKEYDLNGIIATNTSSNHTLGPGGLSGRSIKKQARSLRAKVCECLAEDKSKTIIGVGGIDSYQDIVDFWKMGGDFVQVYTSFIYQGPKLLTHIKNGIDKDLEKHKCRSLNELLKNRALL